MSQKSAKNMRKIEELEALLRQSEEKNAHLEAEVSRLSQKLERMNELLLNAQRARFGQSSEKTEYVLKGQETLFNEAEAVADPSTEEPVEPEEINVSAHKRAKKPKRTLEELKKTIPTRQVLLEIPEEDRVCAKCGGKLKAIGKKYVRSEINFIPAQYECVEYYTVTYACENCEPKTGFASIYSVKAKPALLKHSFASASTVADVIVKKYADGMPLARQEKILKRSGIELSRATLANWVIEVSKRWLRPVYRRMKRMMLESGVIHADETVIQVLKEDGKPATSESRMWVYATPERSVRQIRLFEYQPDRKGIRAAEFLKGFKGCLVTDGYSGYDQVPGVTRCGCWAHMRRKWREAMPKGATLETSKAAVGYNYVNKLFSMERNFAKMPSEQRKYARQAMEEPLLDAYWLWLKTVNAASGSKLEEAVRYAQNQKEYLCAFLEHGDVEISNNFADYPEWLFSTYTGSKRKKAIEDLQNTIRILKFYSNNDFAFKDVHNEELLYQNGKILVEMVQLFEKYRIVYPSKHQFLGDLFEQLLNKGFKQNEGQFFTPIPITRFIWDSLPVDQMVKSERGTVYPKVIEMKAPKLIQFNDLNVPYPQAG